MKRLSFGKLTNHKILLCYVSYLTKQTPEINWGTTWGYIRVRVPSWSIRDMDKHIFMVKILSLPFVLAVSSPVSPFQKSGGCKSDQIRANCSGLDLPSFQFNLRYPAAMGPVSQIHSPSFVRNWIVWS